MIYKDFQDLKLSALGMGCMRLPVVGGNDAVVDEAAAEEMVDCAMANGVNYYDTAWGYHNGNSEIALGKALAKHPREKFYIADKFPGYDLSNMPKVQEIFEEQLKKCRVDYFDFYLFHNVCEMNIDAYLNEEKYGTYAYLMKQRHIDRDIITHFARAGTLYEDAEYHNAVFVGTDEHSVPRHAQKRSTNSCGRAIKLNVEGSEARYSFHHLGDDGDLYVFEAPIDLLSYITLHPENWQQHSYVACCGTSYEPVRWILTRMEAPQMVSLCLDHDNAGDQGCERMAKQISSEFGFPTRRLVPEQKDWNEDLCALREAPRRQRMEMEMR